MTESSIDSSDERVKKVIMLAQMLAKLSSLYPKFCDKVIWVESHKLLADFCIPEGLRFSLDSDYADTYYHSVIAVHVGIPMTVIIEGFHRASELKKSQS
jgi:hypothetical protein